MVQRKNTDNHKQSVDSGHKFVNFVKRMKMSEQSVQGLQVRKWLPAQEITPEVLQCKSTRLTKDTLRTQIFKR